MLICPSETFAKTAASITTDKGHIIWVTADDFRSPRLNVDKQGFRVFRLTKDSPLRKYIEGDRIKTRDVSTISILYFGEDLTKDDPELEAFIEEKIKENPHFDVAHLLP